MRVTFPWRVGDYGRLNDIRNGCRFLDCRLSLCVAPVKIGQIGKFIDCRVKFFDTGNHFVKYRIVWESFNNKKTLKSMEILVFTLFLL